MTVTHLSDEQASAIDRAVETADAIAASQKFPTFAAVEGVLDRLPGMAVRVVRLQPYGKPKLDEVGALDYGDPTGPITNGDLDAPAAALFVGLRVPGAVYLCSQPAMLDESNRAVVARLRARSAAPAPVTADHAPTIDGLARQTDPPVHFHLNFLRRCLDRWGELIGDDYRALCTRPTPITWAEIPARGNSYERLVMTLRLDDEALCRWVDQVIRQGDARDLLPGEVPDTYRDAQARLYAPLLVDRLRMASSPDMFEIDHADALAKAGCPTGSGMPLFERLHALAACADAVRVMAGPAPEGGWEPLAEAVARLRGKLAADQAMTYAAGHLARVLAGFPIEALRVLALRPGDPPALVVRPDDVRVEVPPAGLLAALRAVLSAPPPDPSYEFALRVRRFRVMAIGEFERSRDVFTGLEFKRRPDVVGAVGFVCDQTAAFLSAGDLAAWLREGKIAICVLGWEEAS